ncbi:MAG: glycoside hydrolase family 97 N-terminal domain-containing protein [Phycisphaerae bacterium]|nr:glycoside hydrolase family 97 N-terminal domain-containing protein [Phycisphaerae bacterium]
MKLAGILIGLAAVFNAGAKGGTLSSPDGNVTATVTVADSDGLTQCLLWRVAYKGKAVIADSPLMFELKEMPALGIGCRITDVGRRTHDETWRPVYGERSAIRDHYNQMDVDIRDEQNRRLRLTVRAYDAGVALQYTFPEQSTMQTFTIKAERTQFRFTANHTAWAVYSAQGVYSRVTLSEIKPNCERPLTIELAGGPAVAVAEAALVDYARMRLQPVAGVPFAVESMLAGDVQAKTPYSTPWRVLMIADDACGLLEQNDFIRNLNAPCAIQDTSWIKPGKVIREVTLTTEGGKACVDFAVQRGLQYVEYDAGWYGHEYDNASDATTITVDPKRSPGPLDLHEVIRYADERNIGIIVYVNQRALERQLDEILPLYRSWGIKGVKYGFVRVGDQKWTTWLHEAIRKAADNHLMLDIHDEYRPTGYSRTYPNLMTMEGIRGNEEMPTAEENLILPFTRYLCGAGDYTICWYSGRVKNSNAHQLAAAVVCYSPWQFLYWYDRPAMYKGEPELEFFKHVPTVWDDTRVLHGRIGEYVTLARRSGDAWFVGTMNAVKRRQIDIPLAFLEPGREYTAHVYGDAKPDGSDRLGVTTRHCTVDSTTTLTGDMASNGGQAIHLIPVGR